MSQQRMITPPLLTNEAQVELLKITQMHNQTKSMTQAEKLKFVEGLQNQLGALKESYSDDTLEFASLRLAYDTTRIAWYAINKEPRAVLGKMESLTCATKEFERVLFNEVA